MKKSFVNLALLAVLCSAGLAPALAADPYPTKPIRLLVGFAVVGPPT